MNLQLFAQEKTEKATPRKRQKARQKGQVFSSRDLTTALMLIASIFIFKYYLIGVINGVMKFMIESYSNFFNLELTVQNLSHIFIQSLTLFLYVIVPLAFGTFITGIIVNVLQTGLIFNLELIIPKFERINPIEGLKRVFSTKSLIELLKVIIKVTVISIFSYNGVITVKDGIDEMMDMSMEQILSFFSDVLFKVVLKISLALLILAVLDYLYQWYEYEKSLRMSKEDIKEELKEIEGNPQIKARIRQIQRQLARRRMMQDLKKADVVITNPTHLAVALSYDSNKHDAPVVIAKGMGEIALKIKQVAVEENIPIVENPSLARTLYKSVEIGETIPEELYQAVAEILAYIYSLKGRRI
ncbi:flagellar biosynthesis protein FlhB [Thermovenabulum gondwanense]|uniref:Flagellar biosynthetic protein FlhB n=1 Tax=Thermovenabulum gondwanense TaxID=520767 RepID=A0A162M942_9FIRM|nr:flagellar biosynthesis protein FlhB [Thermovenabulum gondwanense]KYO64570.1 Flagellar biosynthetic protein FlhB [Thermovenabulum gondwanense]